MIISGDNGKKKRPTKTNKKSVAGNAADCHICAEGYFHPVSNSAESVLKLGINLEF